MKKKLFSLLTLLLCAGTFAWAQPYTNEASTVTWAFTSHESLGSTNVPSDAFLTTGFTKGSNLNLSTFSTKDCKAGWSEYSMVYVKPTVTVAKNAADDDANLLEWTITPATGITFIPTNVSMTVCTAGGTGDPQITIYAVYSDDTKETVQTITNPRRPDKTDQGDGPSVYTKALTSAVAGKFKVRAYLAGLTNTSKGIAVTNIAVTGTVSGTPVATTTYTLTVEANDNTLGTVSGGGVYAENDVVALDATPSTGAKFVKWQKDGADFIGNTTAAINVTATADATYTAIFEALNKITFAAGGGTGNVPETAYVEDGEDYVVPAAYFLYKSGSTLTGWNDGTTTYAIGETIEGITDDITLTAQYAANTVALGDATATVNWTFARASNAPTIICEGAETDYVQHTTISGTAYDAVMHIDTRSGKVISGYNSNGKINNSSNTAYAQVNKGTKFTVPVINGAVITYTTTQGTPAVANVTFGGENGTLSERVFTYTYVGETGTLDIIATEGNLYPSGISVSYPEFADVAVTGVTVDEAAEVEVGGTVMLTADVLPADATNKNVTWESDNETVATVENGVVTGVAAGTANITVTTEDGSFSATCEVTVTPATGPIVTLPTETRTGYSVSGSTTTVDYSGNVYNQETVCLIPSNGSVVLTIPSITNVTKIRVSGTSNDNNASTVTITGVVGEFVSSEFNNRKSATATELDFNPTTQTTTFTISSTSKGSWVKIAVYGVEAETITTNVAGWTSYTPVKNATLSDGAKAYYVTAITNDKVTATPVTTLAAGKGYFVKGAASTGYTATFTEATADGTDGTMLVGCLTSTVINDDTVGQNFILGHSGETAGLYEVDSDVTVAAGKAYLCNTGEAAGRFLTLDLDETTGISAALMNGETENNDVYDLSGRKIVNGKSVNGKLQKGLYIVNGKKVVVR